MEKNVYRPGSYNVYKSTGALQATLLLPSFREDGYIDREGAILLEIAPGNKDKKNPSWDWAQKQKFALGLPDIALLIDQTKEEPSIVHDNKGVIKTLKIREGKDNFAGTYQLTISAKENGQIMVPMSNGEYNLFMRLIAAAAPRLLGWI